MGSRRIAEFRQEAVRVALTSGLSLKQVASDFSVGLPAPPMCRFPQGAPRDLHTEACK